MILSVNISIKGLVFSVAAAAALLMYSGKAAAQEILPHPITVSASPSQGLNFGAFTVAGSGGTLSISSGGTRTSTGGVVQLSLGYTFTPALFEIEANPGTVISILNGPDVTLTGSAGGTLSLHLGTSNPSSPFITTAIPPAKTMLTIGGTITVGVLSANPPGFYSGVFYITAIKE